MVRELTTKADFRVWLAQQDQKIVRSRPESLGDLLIYLTNQTALARCFALERPF